MDKDEVICQLKQETVAVLESEDEKAATIIWQKSQRTVNIQRKREKD